jgi:hypothetical protein
LLQSLTHRPPGREEGNKASATEHAPAPWLLDLEDSVGATDVQVVISSHHPEIVNMLAPDCGIELTRERSGPTMTRLYRQDPECKLEPAEIVA